MARAVLEEDNAGHDTVGQRTEGRHHSVDRCTTAAGTWGLAGSPVCRFPACRNPVRTFSRPDILNLAEDNVDPVGSVDPEDSVGQVDIAVDNVVGDTSTRSTALGSLPASSACTSPLANHECA